jgi:hypothetical protein
LLVNFSPRAILAVIDRVGRSLIELLSVIQHLEGCGIDRYLDAQFEPSIIKQRA